MLEKASVVVSNGRPEVKVNYTTHHKTSEMYIWRFFPFRTPLPPTDNLSRMRLVPEAGPSCLKSQGRQAKCVSLLRAKVNVAPSSTRHLLWEQGLEPLGLLAHGHGLVNSSPRM